MGNVCAFIGHGSEAVGDDIRERLEREIARLIESGGVDTFYSGGYGNFDAACAQAVYALKKVYPHVRSYYITPYLAAGNARLKTAAESGLYDGIVYPGLEKVPQRLAVLKRNEYMVRSAGYIIAYVGRTFGGAYKAFTYAKSKRKHIINLGAL